MSFSKVSHITVWSMEIDYLIIQITFKPLVILLAVMALRVENWAPQNLTIILHVYPMTLRIYIYNEITVSIGGI